MLDPPPGQHRSPWLRRRVRVAPCPPVQRARRPQRSVQSGERCCRRGGWNDLGWNRRHAESIRDRRRTDRVAREHYGIGADVGQRGQSVQPASEVGFGQVGASGTSDACAAQFLADGERGVVKSGEHDTDIAREGRKPARSGDGGVVAGLSKPPRQCEEGLGLGEIPGRDQQHVHTGHPGASCVASSVRRSADASADQASRLTSCCEFTPLPGLVPMGHSQR